jgi:hypothetical protein
LGATQKPELRYPVEILLFGYAHYGSVEVDRSPERFVGVLRTPGKP